MAKVRVEQLESQAAIATKDLSGMVAVTFDLSKPRHECATVRPVPGLEDAFYGLRSSGMAAVKAVNDHKRVIEFLDKLKVSSPNTETDLIRELFGEKESFISKRVFRALAPGEIPCMNSLGFLFRNMDDLGKTYHTLPKHYAYIQIGEIKILDWQKIFFQEIAAYQRGDVLTKISESGHDQQAIEREGITFTLCPPGWSTNEVIYLSQQFLKGLATIFKSRESIEEFQLAVEGLFAK